jgi:hypothetical protein
MEDRRRENYYGVLEELRKGRGERCPTKNSGVLCHDFVTRTAEDYFRDIALAKVASSAAEQPHAVYSMLGIQTPCRTDLPKPLARRRALSLQEISTPLNRVHILNFILLNGTSETGRCEPRY